MGAFITVFAVIALIGFGVVWTIWKLTRRIERLWLRSMIRALALAIAFTPTIVPAPGLHGALPMPAVLALVCGVFHLDTYPLLDLQYGAIPLLLVFAIVWLIYLGVAWIRARAET